jgi:hypothetical protein
MMAKTPNDDVDGFQSKMVDRYTDANRVSPAGRSKAYLLVGGHHDGRTREIAYEPDVVGINWPATLSVSAGAVEAARLSAQQKTLVRQDLYKKTLFSTPERRIVVYAHDTLAPGDVLAALVDNYAPAGKPLDPQAATRTPAPAEENYSYSVSVPIGEVDCFAAEIGRRARPEHGVEIKLTEALEAAVELGNEVNRLRADAARYRWQPIETAPKHESVLLWDGIEPVVGNCSLGWWKNIADAEIEPTHWMTLPEPPK